MHTAVRRDERNFGQLADVINTGNIFRDPGLRRRKHFQRRFGREQEHIDGGRKQLRDWREAERFRVADFIQYRHFGEYGGL